MDILNEIFKRSDIRKTLGVLALWLIVYLTVRISIRRSKLDLDHKQQIRQSVLAFTTLIVLMAMVGIWLRLLQEVAVALTAFAVAFVLSFKDLISCFVGGMFRAVSQKYKIGDRIHVGNIFGDVVAIGFLSSTISQVDEKDEQSTGRLIHLPHGDLLTKSVINETECGGLLWAEIDIPLKKPENFLEHQTILETAASPFVEQNIKTLQENIMSLQEFYAVKSPPLVTRSYISHTKDNKPQITLRFPVLPRQKRDAVDAILREYYIKAPKEESPEEIDEETGDDMEFTD